MKAILRNLGYRTVLLAVGGGLALAGGALALGPPSPAPVSNSESKPAVTRGPVMYSFAPVVQKVSPSVVKVFTSKKGATETFSIGPGFGEPGFGWFFGDPREGRGLQRNFRSPREHGVGSGVIVDKEGYILTNQHVVDGADTVKVSLQDGREFTAKVVGTDPKTDVAVLKVEAKDLPAIQTADSDQIQVGDVVLAIGNPFGIGQTVTMGMVSAKGRGNMGLDYEDFIQTDAAINPGNSGGALVDAEGRLIGINTAILSRSGGNQGIGFAIPINLARYVKDSLVKDGRVSRGYLGVVIQDLNPALAKEFQLNDRQGVLVSDVTADGPAGRAGMKSGDVVIEFNHKPVQNSRQLKLEVAQTKPGKTVPVKFLRQGAAKNLEVTLRALPGEERQAKTHYSDREDTGTLEGVAVSDLDSRTRQQMEIPAQIRGVLVTDVAPDSAAYEAGLKSGDVIQEINRQPVKSADEAVRLTEHAKDKTTLLRVWSQGNSHYVVVDEGQAG